MADDLNVDTINDTNDGNTADVATLKANKGADGFISLREAILAVNNDAGGNHSITFDSTVFVLTAQAVIEPTSSLPTISKTGTNIDASNAGVTLDGTTAGGDGLTFNATNCQLKGMYIRDWSDAIQINGGNVTIGGSSANERNFLINNTDDGIEFASASNNTVIQGNYIGTNLSFEDLGNAGDGIHVNGTGAITIGGTGAGESNHIDWHDGVNDAGIRVENGSPVIQGNFIGTDTTGNNFGNHDGINLETGADNLTIGGTAANSDNTIGRNDNYGIWIQSNGSTATVQGNFIGGDNVGNTYPNGDSALHLDNAGATLNLGNSAENQNNILVGGPAQQSIEITNGTLELGGTVDVNGDIDINGGTFDLNSDFLVVTGDIDPTGGTFTIGSNSTLTLDGAAVQTLTSITNFENLHYAGSSHFPLGTYTIDDALIVESGAVTAPGVTVTFNSGATIKVGEGTASPGIISLDNATFQSNNPGTTQFSFSIEPGGDIHAKQTTVFDSLSNTGLVFKSGSRAGSTFQNQDGSANFRFVTFDNIQNAGIGMDLSALQASDADSFIEIFQEIRFNAVNPGNGTNVSAGANTPETSFFTNTGDFGDVATDGESGDNDASNRIFWLTHILVDSLNGNSATDVDGNTTSVANLLAGKGADGLISLREAITAINNDTTGFIIKFDPATFPTNAQGQINISGSALPSITQADTHIDATDTGVTLDGSALGAGSDGLSFAANNGDVRGLYIRNFPDDGLVISSGFVMLGGDESQDRNFLLGNGGDGIDYSTTTNGTVILGNYIGTNLSLEALGNSGDGILVNGTGTLTIGGTGNNEGNVIARNTDEGIEITANATVSIQGNAIGTDSTGSPITGANGGNGLELSTGSIILGNGSETQNNILTASANSFVVVQNGGTLDLAGTVTLDGDLDLNSGTFDLNAALVSVTGDISATGSTFTQGTSTITLDGTATQLLTDLIIYNLNYSGTAGASFESATSITNQLVVESGAVTAGSVTLTFSANTDLRVGQGANSPAVISFDNTTLTSTTPGTDRFSFSIEPGGDLFAKQSTTFNSLDDTGIVVRSGGAIGTGQDTGFRTVTFDNISATGTGMNLSALVAGDDAQIPERVDEIRFNGNTAGNNVTAGVNTPRLNFRVNTGNFGTLAPNGEDGDSDASDRIFWLASDLLLVDTTGDTDDGDTSSVQALNANVGADGVISLREAITAVNNDSGTDFVISFDSTVFLTTAQGQITVGGSVLPTITSTGTLIDGSQAGVTVDGNSTITDGLTFNGTNCILQGLYIRNFTDDGVVISGGNLTLGGTSSTQRNFIFGNTDDGIEYTSTTNGTVILGNYIGTNLSFEALGNGGDGILANGTGTFTIGGTASGAGNVIARNTDEGIEITANATVSIQGNAIGTDSTGSPITGANGGNGVELSTGSVTLGSGSETQNNTLTASTNSFAIVQNGGTLDLAGTVTLDGDLDLNSGTFDLNAALVSVTGDISATGSTFTQGTSTITLDGTATQLLTDLTVYNLNYSGTSQASFESATSITNQLVVESGAVTAGNVTLTFSANTDLRVGQGATSPAVISFDGTTLTSTNPGTDRFSFSIEPGGDLFAKQSTTFNSIADTGIVVRSGGAIGTGQDAGFRTVTFDNISATGTGMDLSALVAGDDAQIPERVDEIRFNGNTAGNNVTAGTNTPRLNFHVNVGNFGTLAPNGEEGDNDASERVFWLASDLLLVDTTGDTDDGDTSSVQALSGNAGADGVISLREAITAVNNDSGTDFVISFDSTVFPIAAQGQITVGGAVLPTITSTGTLIDGSQAGVTVDGNSTISDGLTFNGTNCILRGLYIRNFTDDGIVISGGNLTLGGTSATEKNFIFGNTGDGIDYSSSTNGTVILGNHIGTNLSLEALGNGGDGILVNGTGTLTIGGTASGAGNVISRNTDEGIEITANATVSIQGNAIGTDSTGSPITGANGGNGIELSTGSITLGSASETQNNTLTASANRFVVVQNGGNLDLAGTVTFDGDLDLNSGTFDLNAALISVTGDINATGVTMTPDTSTITLDGTTIQLLTDITAHNLNYSGTTSASFESASSITNQLVVESGAVTAGNVTLTFSNNASIKVGQGATSPAVISFDNTTLTTPTPGSDRFSFSIEPGGDLFAKQTTRFNSIADTGLVIKSGGAIGTGQSLGFRTVTFDNISATGIGLDLSALAAGDDAQIPDQVDEIRFNGNTSGTNVKAGNNTPQVIFRIFTGDFGTLSANGVTGEIDPADVIIWDVDPGIALTLLSVTLDATPGAEKIYFIFNTDLLPGSTTIADWRILASDGITNIGSASTLQIINNQVIFNLSASDSTGGNIFYLYFGTTLSDVFSNLSVTFSSGSAPTVTNEKNQQGPPDFFTIDFTVSDADGGPVSLDVALISGPVTLNLSDVSDQTIGITVDGTYVFAATVTDNVTLTSQTRFNVTVDNVAPLAFAFPKIQAVSGDTVTLDGSNSNDGNGFGDITTLFWRLLDGPVTSLSITQDETTGVATFDSTVLLPGVYTFQLQVTDDNAVSNDTTLCLLLQGPTLVPIADAGIGGRLNFSSIPIPLLGHESIDPQGGALNYGWAVVEGRGGSFDATNIPQPDFTPTQTGVYKFSLVVTNNQSQTSPTSFVTWIIDDPPTLISVPFADAGTDKTVSADQTVTLDGTGSADRYGAALTYQWSQTAGPAISLDNSTLVQPQTQVNLPGIYEFSLAVSNDHFQSVADSVTFHVVGNNFPPLSDAGPDQTRNVGDQVTLDGSSSSDVNGDPLTFNWSQIRGPAVSFDATSVNPFFTVANSRVYEFELRVSDGLTSSTADRVSITVNGANSVPIAIAGQSAGNDFITTDSSTASLNGSLSSDPDNDTLTFINWIQTSGPPAIINDPTSLNTSIETFITGNYAFELYVDDGNDRSTPDQLTIQIIDVASLGFRDSDGGICLISSEKNHQNIGFFIVLILLGLALALILDCWQQYRQTNR